MSHVFLFWWCCPYFILKSCFQCHCRVHTLWIPMREPWDVVPSYSFSHISLLPPQELTVDTELTIALCPPNSQFYLLLPSLSIWTSVHMWDSFDSDLAPLIYFSFMSLHIAISVLILSLATQNILGGTGLNSQKRRRCSAASICFHQDSYVKFNSTWVHWMLWKLIYSRLDTLTGRSITWTSKKKVKNEREGNKKSPQRQQKLRTRFELLIT